MQPPAPYWSLTYGPSSSGSWIDESANGQLPSSRAHSIGRLNSTSSGYSSSSNSGNNSTPTPHYSESYSSTSDNLFAPHHLSEDQFDIIDDLKYDDVDDVGLIGKQIFSPVMATKFKGRGKD